MSTTFSYSTFAVINEGCPVDQTVLGSNTVRVVLGALPDAIELEFDYVSIRTLARASVRVVLGALPDAIELEFDYVSIRTLARASTDALKEMRARFADRYGDDADDPDDDEPDDQPGEEPLAAEGG